ncbi:MAG: type II secretion system F family protein [Candidatus Pacebacteria bacterium]|nr:type II secretion system F family protein [Candidatus Paceibacterota bacterium]
MPQFSYKAKTIEEEVQTGIMKADNRADLTALLRQKGLILISAQQDKKNTKMELKRPEFLNRVGVVDRMLFARNLAVMLRAGLSFSRSLDVLSEQTKSKYFGEVLKQISQDVQRGTPLADSLQKYPKVFNNLFVSMVHVGETGGNLEEVLDMLAIQLKKDHDITSKVRGAMMYPAVILTAMGGVGVAMMMFVFPNLLNMFSEANAELPASTKALIFISNALQNYGVWIFAGLVVLLILLLKAIKTPEGKKVFDGLLLKLPVVKDIIMKVNVARFSRTLSSMIVSGVSIVQALDIISGTLNNYYFKTSTADACQKVQKGVDLSEVIAGYDKIYPSMMIHMIEVGEETGSLESTLKQVAEFYEEEVDQFTSNLSSVIEPILMLIMGLAVGVFAISLIQPMYSIMETI